MSITLHPIVATATATATTLLGQRPTMRPARSFWRQVAVIEDCDTGHLVLDHCAAAGIYAVRLHEFRSDAIGTGRTVYTFDTVERNVWDERKTDDQVLEAFALMEGWLSGFDGRLTDEEIATVAIYAIRAAQDGGGAAQLAESAAYLCEPDYMGGAA